MRYLKMLGLAAVAAMALMAFLGASSASATVLCKTTSHTTNCASSGWDWPVGTVIHAELEDEAHATLDGLWTNVTCETSTIEGEVDVTGGESATVSGAIDSLIFDDCTCDNGDPATVNVLSLGELEVHHTGTQNGTMTGRGTVTTIECGSIQCRFGSGTGIHLGTLIGGHMATVDAAADVLWSSGTGDEGTFLCGSSADWLADYTVTEPEPLFVSTS